jgi:hypothetical protein
MKIKLLAQLAVKIIITHAVLHFLGLPILLIIATCYHLFELARIILK